MAEAPLGGSSGGVTASQLDQRIGEATDAIRERLAAQPALATPRIVAVLGSGLGGVVELLDGGGQVRISYGDIPNVPCSSVEGHAGELAAGTVAGIAAIMLSGRAHPYEGHSHAESTLLLRAALALGPDTVILTNAAGGMNPAFGPGDVMLIADHINLSGDNPLRGPNLDRFGPRFPAMTDAYDPELRRAARDAGARIGLELREGVYVMLTGPSYETRAEMRMLRALGADAVGMSTAHEAIVARHAGRRVLGFSLITNMAMDEVEAGATHAEVMEVGEIGAERLVRLLAELLPQLA